MASEVIAAVATAPGRGGIGVVRVSGPKLGPMLDALVRRLIKPRAANRAHFLDARGQVIDEGLVLFFPAPHSYTGEDVIELQGHGGPIVLNLLLQRCLELGARVAEPGEFTKRAFLNNKIDLAQAESVADLIDAASAQAARCAVKSLQGAFSAQITATVDALINLRMLVEATLDFPEEDLELLDRARARDRLTEVRSQLAAILAASSQGRLLREGAHVVLAGQPNVGKSSLLNALAGAERAIVTEIPGTTRDTIREPIVLDGVPLHIIDTAGIREPTDPVEKIGISRTWDVVGQADLLLWVSDLTRPETFELDAKVISHIPAGVPRLEVRNKVDIGNGNCGVQRFGQSVQVCVSAKTGDGLSLLKAEILVGVGWGGGAEGVYLARERHIQALKSADKHLTSAAAKYEEIELFAEELRLAQRDLSTITGEFSADDLLGKIFSSFCIGK